jgi:3',5'-nucleoside bisphosphate phosphatase
MKNIDLHIHTYYSDGKFSPKEIIGFAEKYKLKAISITDHDTIKAYDVLKTIKTNIEIINGVEIQANTTEILGYLIDLDNNILNNILYKNKIAKEEYIYKKIDALKDMNLDLEIEELYEIAKPADVYLNSHIAKLLLNKGYINNIQEGFKKYLNKIKVKTSLGITNTKKVIKGIINAGGLAVLPHPWYLKEEIQENLFSFISKLKDYGLVGIETTGYIPEDKLKYFKNIKLISKELELIECGGSDFHNLEDYPNNILGKYNLNYNIIKKLKKKQKKCNL